jgi:Tubulin-tyrosine ligase family
MSGSGVLNPTTKEQEANYGRMVSVSPPTMDNAILRRNIRMAVHKLTSNPPRPGSPEHKGQEVGYLEKIPKNVDTSDNNKFSFALVASEQATAGKSSSSISQGGLKFRIKNDKSNNDLQKKTDKLSIETKKPESPQVINLLGARKPGSSPRRKVLPNSAMENLGLLYTIHEDKDKFQQNLMKQPQSSVTGRPPHTRSPLTRSATKEGLVAEKQTDPSKNALWLKYRHGAWKSKNRENLEDRPRASSSSEVGDTSQLRSDSRGRIVKTITELGSKATQGERVGSLAKHKQAQVSSVIVTPRSVRDEPKLLGGQALTYFQLSKAKSPAIRIQSVQQSVRKKVEPSDYVEKKVMINRPSSSQKIMQIDSNPKPQKGETVKSKPQLMMRFSPAVGRKISGQANKLENVGGVEKSPEQKEAGLSNRGVRPNTKAVLVGPIVSKSNGFTKLKKGMLSVDKPKRESERGRKFSKECALLNLMYGLVMRGKLANSSGEADIRYNVCSGNNGGLVEGMIRNKPHTAHENMYHKSQIQWSQTHHKNLVPSAWAGIPKIPFRELGNLEDYKDFPLTEPNRLAVILSEAKLFKVDQKKIKLAEVFGMIMKSSYMACSQTDHVNVCNHLQGVTSIAHKTKLTETMIRFAKARKIDPFSIIPESWMIRLRTADQDIERILTARKGVDWKREPVIVKPGENTNRGVGITMGYSPEEAFQSALSLLRSQKGVHSVIIQSYITNPLLYKKRKFDIRCYGLIVKYSNKTFYFWYGDGYARTSSYEFTVDCKTNLMVHLTNEAVQVKGRFSL